MHGTEPRGAAVGGALLAAILFAAAFLASLTAPLFANGGTVRISRAAVGPYVVSVMSAPTPLRTGEVDISVLVQDSTDEVVPGTPVDVEAVPLTAAGDTIRHAATRQQATNKFFLAAKFDVEAAGEWEFRVRVGEEEGGVVAFQAMVTEATLLDSPYLLTLLILAPILLVWWLLGRREDAEREPERAGRSAEAC